MEEKTRLNGGGFVLWELTPSWKVMSSSNAKGGFDHKVGKWVEKQSNFYEELEKEMSVLVSCPSIFPYFSWKIFFPNQRIGFHGKKSNQTFHKISHLIFQLLLNSSFFNHFLTLQSNANKHPKRWNIWNFEYFPGKRTTELS